MSIPVAAWVLSSAALLGYAVFQTLLARNERRERDRARGDAAGDRAALLDLQSRLQELERARARAEESNEAKNEYLANVSHEIRTPLAGIIGMNQIALDSELTPEQRTCIESAQTSAQSLLRIINDILDFSKIEARKLDLQVVHFDLHDRISEVAKSFGVGAQKKGLELALHILPGVPHNVVGDDGRLRQVLNNLIGNAVKFTESGEIVVRVELETKSKQDVLIHTTVRDTGPGIPPGREQSIFKAFEQADPTITSRFGGTGLGLSIAARLVELMGGRIWVESSSETGGSTFHFTMRLWLQRVATLDPRPILPQSAARQNVLVVDDHPAAREILASILENWDLEVASAASAEEALALMTSELERGRGFAFVLIDAGLEGGGGFELAEVLRKRPNLPGSVVMMLPSPGDFEGAARCRQLELSSYVTKPISESELADAITRALHSPVPVLRPSSSTVALRSAFPRRLLVVEDEPVNRALAASMLERWGHTVGIAESGEEALKKLASGEFDAVLMDLQMPRMGGLELTRKVRAGESGAARDLPIIGTSARAGRADRQSALEAGMDDYVAKPLNVNDLFGAIERAAARTASPEVLRAEEDAGATAREILQRVDGNVELARRITAMFLNDTPPLLDALRDAVLANDGAEIASLAHRLKGSVANFPFERATAAAARLEVIGRRGDRSGVESALSELDDSMEDAMLSLELALAKLQTAALR